MEIEKYRIVDKIETIDISGFGIGSGYENACQRMLQNGVNFLFDELGMPDPEHDLRILRLIPFPNETDDSKRWKRFEKAVSGIEGPTGAMFFRRIRAFVDDPSEGT